MNRAQRRLLARKPKKGNNVGTRTENIPLKVTYGHTATHVVMQFSQPITNVTSTPEQARDMIKQIQVSLDLLEAHQKGQQGAQP